MQIEQFEIIFQMEGKFQKPLIGNFEFFEGFCGIVIVLVVFFVKL